MKDTVQRNQWNHLKMICSRVLLYMNIIILQLKNQFMALSSYDG